jgi:hypothetical protein
MFQDGSRVPDSRGLMVHAHKEYQRAFLIEPTKLRCLVDTIHDCLDDDLNGALHDTFEVFLVGRRLESMTSLDEVLALDNSGSQRIVRLAITCSVSSVAAARAEREVQVDFARPKPINAGRSKHEVAIGVRGESAEWVDRTLGQAEEQIERTWIHHPRSVAVLIGLLLVGLLLVSSQFVAPRPTLSADWWLSSADLERVEAMLTERPTLTDEDLREVSTLQLQNVLAAHRPTRLVREGQTRRTVLLAAPLVILVAGMGVLLATCYPREVFLWGDEVERYANLVHRQRTIWSIIVGVTVVSISTRFLVEDVSSWFLR